MLWRPQPNYATHFVRPCSGRRCLRRPPDRSSRIASDDDATRTTAISSTYGATFFSVPANPPEMPVRLSLSLLLLLGLS